MAPETHMRNEGPEQDWTSAVLETFFPDAAAVKDGAAKELLKAPPTDATERNGA